MLALTFEPVVALLCDLEEVRKRRSVVVRPVIAGDSPSKVSRRVVRGALGRINYVVFFAMFLIQEGRNLQKVRKRSAIIKLELTLSIELR